MNLLTLLLFYFTMAEKVFAISAPDELKSALPQCVAEPAKIESIKAVAQTHSKNARKYDGYKKILSADSDEELFARLVYAETLAANCPEQNVSIAWRIAEVIHNRIKKRGDVKKVVFERDQFASSMNFYGESRFQDFLCPKDKKLWDWAIQRSQGLLSGESPNTLSPDTVNYFLYKHSPKWSKEPWSLKEDQAHSDKRIQKCLRTFHNPSWK